MSKSKAGRELRLHHANIAKKALAWAHCGDPEGRTAKGRAVHRELGTAVALMKSGAMSSWVFVAEVCTNFCPKCLAEAQEANA